MLGTATERGFTNTLNTGYPPENNQAGMRTRRTCSIHVPLRDFTGA